ADPPFVLATAAPFALAAEGLRGRATTDEGFGTAAPAPRLSAKARPTGPTGARPPRAASSAGASPTGSPTRTPLSGFRLPSETRPSSNLPPAPTTLPASFRR